jgi:hypothetical protein
MNYDGSLTTAPNPWFSVNQEEIPSELLITKSPDGSIGTSWVVQDLNLGTVLGYLARGAFNSALRVGSQDSALESLFNKYTNPLGAAAGG